MTASRTNKRTSAASRAVDRADGEATSDRDVRRRPSSPAAPGDLDDTVDDDTVDDDTVDDTGPLRRPTSLERWTSSAVGAVRRLGASVWSGRADIVGAAASALLATTAMVLVMRLWRMDFGVPLGPSTAVDPLAANDTLLATAGFRTIDNSSWYFFTDRLGAPFGQDLRFFPAAAGDALHVIAVKVLGLVADNPGAIFNAFTLATFPAVAIAAYVGARMLWIRRSLAIFFAVVFTTLPMHFLRFGIHPFLANYSSVPLMVALAFRQTTDRPIVRLVDGHGWRRAVHRDNVLAFLLALYTATTGVYYSAFAILLLAIVGLAAFVRGQRDRWKPLAALTVVMVFVIGAQILPTVIAVRTEGGAAVSSRDTLQFESYALRPSVMFAPVRGHRVNFVAQRRNEMPASQIRGESESEALGLVTSVGVLIGLAALVGVAIGRRRPAWLGPLQDAPLASLVFIVTATVSGGNAYLALVGVTQIRAWNRSSVFIAAFGGLILAKYIEMRLDRGGVWRRRPLLLPAVLVLTGGLAVLDQTTDFMVPPYEDHERTWRSDQAIVRAIEADLPPGSAVFNLPVADFPEAAPMFDMRADSQLIGYIHSQTLRWSYGGVKRRETEWRYRLDPTSPEIVDELILAGFRGVLVDRRGFGDEGKDVDRVLRDGGAEPKFVSRDGNQRFYSLMAAAATIDDRIPAAEQPALREALLRTPLPQFWTGFDRPENDRDDYLWHWSLRRASELRIEVGDGDPTSGELVIDIETIEPGAHNLWVWVNGVSRREPFEISEERAEVRIPLDLDEGMNVIRLRTDAGPDDTLDPRTLYFRIFGVPRFES